MGLPKTVIVNLTLLFQQHVVTMAGRKRAAARSSGRQNGAEADRTGGQIYQDMLQEVGVNALSNSSPERPLKRRRPASKREEKLPEQLAQGESSGSKAPRKEVPDAGGATDDDEDEEIEFQDVVIPAPTVQTMELESDEDDEDEDIEFEDVDFMAPLNEPSAASQEPKVLELNLTVQKSSSEQAKKAVERRRPITKDERQQRIAIHKTHILCLLSHVARRNHWCNDTKVQDYLHAHLTDKMVTYLNPGTNLSQFGRTESLKNGLKQVEGMWKTKFEITERGLRRSLWAEDVKQLEDVGLPLAWVSLANMTSMSLRVTWNLAWIAMISAKPPRNFKDLEMSARSFIARSSEVQA